MLFSFNKKIVVGMAVLCLVLSVFSIASPVFAQTNPAGATQVDTPASCSGLFCQTFNNILAGIASFFLRLCGMVLWAAGVLLNFVVSFTIVDMANNVGKISSINIAWGTVRDVANIGFIFALLYIGIATILRIENYGARRLLAGLIIAALLINFSLFFSKVIIDASNIFAYQFYKMMGINDCTGNAFTCADGGLSDRFMADLGVTTIFNTGNDLTTNAGSLGNVTSATQNNSDLKELGWWKIIIVGIFGSIVLLTISFVLFAAAIMLSIRFVILLFLMILSPIGFAASVLPATSRYASQWWSTMLNQALFAPAYLFLTYLSLVVLDGVHASMFKNINYAGAFTGNAANLVGTIFNFFVVIFFMVAALTIAKQLGAYGSSTMMNWGKGLRRFGEARTAGALTRAVVSRTAAGAGKAYNQADLALGEGRAGRFVRGALGAATFGFIGGRRPELKKITDQAQKKQFFGAASAETVKKEVRERRSELAGVSRENTTNSIIRRVRAGETMSDDDQRHIRSLNNKEVEKVSIGNINNVANMQIAGRLTDRQIEDILKSDQITEQDKGKIRQERENYFTDILEHGDIGKLVRSMKPAEAAKLPKKVLKDARVQEHLTSGILSQLIQEWSEEDRKPLRDAIEKEIENANEELKKAEKDLADARKGADAAKIKDAEDSVRAKQPTPRQKQLRKWFASPASYNF